MSAFNPRASHEVIGSNRRQSLLSRNSLNASQDFLEVFTREDIVVGEGLCPPCSVATGVVRALERLTIGLVGAFVVVPRSKVQPLAAASPLSVDLGQITTFGEGNQFVGRFLFQHIEALRADVAGATFVINIDTDDIDIFVAWIPFVTVAIGLVPLSR